MLYGQSRYVPGWQWLDWGPGARRLARAAVVVTLRERVAAEGRVVVGRVEELVRYDEQARDVLLYAEARTVPGAPDGAAGEVAVH